MKIILSPAKTYQSKTRNISLLEEELLFKKEVSTLYRKLKNLSVEEIKAAMNLSDKLAQETHQLYQKHKESDIKTAALEHYSGLAFRQLNLLAYTQDQFDYLDQHLRILSALYGILRPRDGIHPYRLDFTMSLSDLKLRSLWKKRINPYFKNEDWILNLASEEFSSLIQHPNIHSVEFYDQKEGKHFINSAEAKKARGLYLEQCMIYKVSEIHELKNLSLFGYDLIEHTDKNTIYLKQKKSD